MKKIAQEAVGPQGPPTSIIMVDGQAVRDNIETGFIGGTNGQASPEWCPRGAIVLENGFENRDLLAFLVHELREHMGMDKGETYEKAHEEANAAEHRFRGLSKAAQLLKVALERKTAAGGLFRAIGAGTALGTAASALGTNNDFRGNLANGLLAGSGVAGLRGVHSGVQGLQRFQGHQTRAAGLLGSVPKYREALGAAEHAAARTAPGSPIVQGIQAELKSYGGPQRVPRREPFASERPAALRASGNQPIKDAARQRSRAGADLSRAQEAHGAATSAVKTWQQLLQEVLADHSASVAAARKTTRDTRRALGHAVGAQGGLAAASGALSPQ